MGYKLNVSHQSDAAAKNVKQSYTASTEVLSQNQIKSQRVGGIGYVQAEEERRETLLLSSGA